MMIIIFWEMRYSISVTSILISSHIYLCPSRGLFFNDFHLKLLYSFVVYLFLLYPHLRNLIQLRFIIPRGIIFSEGCIHCCVTQQWVDMSQYHEGSWDSVVGTATGYGLDDRGVGVRVPVWSRIFSSPRRPDRLCGPPNLLYNRYRGLFPRG
jgi:hypothetical protein